MTAPAGTDQTLVVVVASSKLGWLQRWDERNQSVSDWLMDHPDAGTQSFPYARSRRARRLLLGFCVATIAAALVFGYVTLLMTVPIAVVASRRLEFHPGREGYRRRVGKSDAPDRESEGNRDST